MIKFLIKLTIFIAFPNFVWSAEPDLLPSSHIKSNWGEIMEEIRKHCRDASYKYDWSLAKDYRKGCEFSLKENLVGILSNLDDAESQKIENYSDVYFRCIELRPHLDKVECCLSKELWASGHENGPKYCSY